MRSERSERMAWLRSQGLGLVCGQACVVLLGVGSVVIAATREGASARVQMDDLRPFFEQPSWVHAWFYALMGVIALYAINTLLCTWDSVRARLARGGSTVSSWAPTVIHVSWLVALVSHLVGGLGNVELQPVVVGSEWSTVDTGSMRLVDLRSEQTDSGKVKQTLATIEVREEGGSVTTDVVGFNAPFSRRLGSELLLLAQSGRADVAVFSLGDARCEVVVPGVCALGLTRVEVVSLQMAENRGGRVVAVVHDGQRGFPLVEGGLHALPGGVLKFEGVSEAEVVQLRHRHSPGNPVALVSAVLLGLGLVMMGRRWIRPVVDS